MHLMCAAKPCANGFVFGTATLHFQLAFSASFHKFYTMKLNKGFFTPVPPNAGL